MIAVLVLSMIGTLKYQNGKVCNGMIFILSFTKIVK
jgi:hypothetical protein